MALTDKEKEIVREMISPVPFVKNKMIEFAALTDEEMRTKIAEYKQEKIAALQKQITELQGE
jgi:uncharacterized protein (DUF39 family)